MNGWLAILRWADDNERLCAMDPRLRLKKSPPRAGVEPETAISVGQRLTHWAIGASGTLALMG